MLNGCWPASAALSPQRTRTLVVVRELIALLVGVGEWDRAERLALAALVLEDPAAAPDAVAAAMVSLHSGVLSPDGLYEVPARSAPTDPSSLIAQLRDLAAQLYALTEP